MESNGNKIIYSINIEDAQKVADEILNRKLTTEELEIIENEVGDYISWFEAIEEVIKQKIIVTR